MNTRRIITIAVVLVVVVGGFFAYRTYANGRAAARMTEDLQIEEVDFGSLEAIVGATGTVSYTHLTLPTNREV